MGPRQGRKLMLKASEAAYQSIQRAHLYLDAKHKAEAPPARICITGHLHVPRQGPDRQMLIYPAQTQRCIDDARCAANAHSNACMLGEC